jgi:fatty-acyl-CoA synthase
VLRADEVSVKAGAAGHAVLPLSDVRLVDAENNPVALASAARSASADRR